MNRFLVGFCLGMTLPACEVGITNSPQKIQDDVSENENVSVTETDTGTGEEETGEEEQEEDTSADYVEDTEETPLTDFSSAGPFDVTVDNRIASVTECTSMDYKVYSPDIDDPTVVILGHGFARGSGVMTGWAEHLSSWGLEVLLPTLCHYNVFFGVDHEMNGQNMIELSILHGATNVIYAGHSAGGLAAIIATAQDTDAMGVLGLDATDTEGIPGIADFIGRRYASEITQSAFSIVGEPSSCNSENNGIDLFKMMENYRIIKIVSSDHCDFENPTNSICTASCENSSVTFDNSEIRESIISLATAAIVDIAQISEDGIKVWEEGLQEFRESGLILDVE